MPVTAEIYEKRRQRLFLVLSGMFLGTLAMLNILGISRFWICPSMYLASPFPWWWPSAFCPIRSPSYART